MRSRRMSKEELVTLKVLMDKGKSNTKIAAILGITEGAVRYHRCKAEAGKASTSYDKPFKKKT